MKTLESNPSYQLALAFREYVNEFGIKAKIKVDKIYNKKLKFL